MVVDLFVRIKFYKFWINKLTHRKISVGFKFKTFKGFNTVVSENVNHLMSVLLQCYSLNKLFYLIKKQPKFVSNIS